MLTAYAGPEQPMGAKVRMMTRVKTLQNHITRLSPDSGGLLTLTRTMIIRSFQLNQNFVRMQTVGVNINEVRVNKEHAPHGRAVG